MGECDTGSPSPSPSPPSPTPPSPTPPSPTPPSPTPSSTTPPYPTPPSPTPPSPTPPSPTPPSPTPPSPPSSAKLYKNKFYQYDKKALISKKKEKNAQTCLNKCKVRGLISQLKAYLIFIYQKTTKPKKCCAMNWSKKKGCFLLSSYQKIQNKKGWTAGYVADSPSPSPSPG